MKYNIKGVKRLEGIVEISGSKNASLPILAGSILNGGVTKIYNLPDIRDVNTTLEILEILGCSISKKRNKVIIDSSKMNKSEIPENLMRELRSSVILAGAIIGRFKKAVFSYPGGCEIGARPIDLHINNFKKIGINIDENAGYIVCNCDKIKSTEIQLDFPSVGATENLILASVLSDAEIIIKNAAMEPEIIDLQNFLNKMGAKISGAGGSCIKIVGVSRLKEISYTIMPDRIETGTFLSMVAATSGELILNNTNYNNISPVLDKLEESGCNIKREKNKISIVSKKRLKNLDIKTLPYPGFPTDMQSIFLSMLTTAKGTSIIVENIFENRYKCVPELNRMGAKIRIEGNTAIIKGVKRLIGTSVKATDLRGGIALVLAGLVANGNTILENVEYIERGYEKLETKLINIGASIYKER
ncbi:MAG: UDP-N-acetylglucosamine 1-carboxyvinyltransferase [Clostridia bacterium]|nr:UDP-N-acetylglucosamine 1-carboxyvinyltransferase [Clostridia bacterium]